MSMWSFKTYTQNGRDEINDEISRLSKKGKANLNRTLEHLAVKPKVEWERPHSSALGNHVYVIRFKDENRTQHRIFGCHHDDQRAFLLVAWAIEKDGVYKPDSDSCQQKSHICYESAAKSWDRYTADCVIYPALPYVHPPAAGTQ